jgi:hypothetical protein
MRNAGCLLPGLAGAPGSGEDITSGVFRSLKYQLGCRVLTIVLLLLLLLLQDGFLVTSRGNKKFSEVDLSDDWVEFDDKINESVGIYSVEAKFELHKGK